MLWTPPKEWVGRRSYIVGGGSSLSDFRFDFLTGRKTIGCNEAFRLGPRIIDTVLFGDAEFFHRRKWEVEKFGGRVVTCAPSLLSLHCDWLKLMNRHRDGLHSGDHLGWNYSTGAAAINLAYSLGSTEIYLLGFDLSANNKGKTHWHKNGLRVPDDASFRRFSRGFDTLAKAIKDTTSVQVFNVTDGSSNLHAFDRISFETFYEILNEDLV
jgi:hypothetical protein